MTLRYWTAFVAVIVAVFAYALTPPPNSRHDAVFLERLAPRVERVKALPSETKDALMQLVTAARERKAAGVREANHEPRRQAALDRLSRAIEDKPSIVPVGATSQQASR